MGDRGNVYVHEGDDPGVFLYSHWGGFNLPREVQAALIKAPERWNDTPYLTRIIFDKISEGEHGGTTGYGISTYVMDPEYPDIDVDTRRQTITVDHSTYSLRDYVDLNLDEVLYIETDDEYNDLPYASMRYDD